MSGASESLTTEALALDGAAKGEVLAYEVPSKKERTVKQRAVRGTMWVMVGFGSSRVIQLVSSLILTRLLVPEAFGLMALVEIFAMGLSMFSDIGIGPSIIQNARGEDPAFLNTAWTMQVIRGFLMFLGCCALGPVAVAIYDRPELKWILPVVGINSIINGFNSTALFSLNRRLSLGRLMSLEFAEKVFATLVVVVWAWISPSVWALVAGGLAGNVLKLTYGHLFLSSIRNHFQWERESVRSLLGFGKWIFASTLLAFFSNKADVMVLGKLVPVGVLGVYGLAYSIYSVPKALLAKIASAVIFPAVSLKANLSAEVLRGKVLVHRRMILYAAAVVTALIATWGDIAVKAMYPPKYHGAAWMLPLLALGLWPRVLCLTIGPVLLARGKPVYSAMSNLGRVVFVLAGLPLVVKLFGILPGMVLLAFADLPMYAAVAVGLKREKLSGFAQDALSTGLMVVLTAAMVALRITIGIPLPSPAV